MRDSRGAGLFSNVCVGFTRRYTPFLERGAILVMKKIFHVAVALVALLSSFTISVSAEFTSTDSANLNNIERELTENAYGGSPTVRGFLRDMYYSFGYTDHGNSGTLRSNIASLIDAVSAVSTRIVELQSLTTTTNSTISISNGYLKSLSEGLSQFYDRNHTDITDFSQYFLALPGFGDQLSSAFPIFVSQVAGNRRYCNFNRAFGMLVTNIVSDSSSYYGIPTLYHCIHQLQQVLASDDDLALKQDNKANEDAATDAFVNGNSSKTSLGTGDIGNLKDVGGTFNDLTSLNGQSSVTSFLNGLTSADGTGQGWFSEATRASLDAVSTPVTTTNLVYKTWRGEKSLIATVSEDSVNSVSSPASAADPDPYNMSGFEDNYNWLWGDAS